MEISDAQQQKFLCEAKFSSYYLILANQKQRRRTVREVREWCVEETLLYFILSICKCCI